MLLESQHRLTTEQLRGELDEANTTISSLQAQIQTVKTNMTNETAVLKEQLHREKNLLQATHDKKADEYNECMRTLEVEKSDILINLKQLQEQASIETSAHLVEIKKLEQSYVEMQEVHRLGMEEKTREVQELHAEMKLQAEQNQMALNALHDDQLDVESKLEKSQLLVKEKDLALQASRKEIQRLTSALGGAENKLSALTIESSDKEEMSKLFEQRLESNQHEISVLQKELSISKQQLQANEDHRILSQNSHIALEAELKVSKESCVDLEDANVRLMKEIEILSSSHESQLEEKISLQKTVDEMIQEREALREEMMHAHGKSELFRREVENVKTQLEDKHKQEVDQLQDQIVSLQRNKDGLKAQKDAITAANECHQEVIDGMKAEVEECQKSITMLTKELQTAHDINGNLSNSVELLEQAKLSYEKMVEERDSVVGALEVKCRDQEAENRATVGRVEGLQQTIEDLSGQLEAASEMLASTESSSCSTVDAMRGEIAVLEDGLKSKEEACLELTGRLHEAEVALEEKDASMLTNQIEISALYSSNKSAETQLTENREVIEQYAMQVQALKVENEMIKSDGEIVKSMQLALDLHSNTVKSLTEELNEKNLLVEQMRQHCIGLESTANATAVRISDLDEKNIKAQAELESLLRMKDESLKDTRKELVEMRDAYRGLLTDQTSQKDQEAAGT